MPESLPISEAAARLGISVDAIRKKIRRGTIPAVKQNDRWYVEVPDMDAAQDTTQPASSTVPDGAITHELVELLRAELEAKNRQIERLTVLLGNAQQTVQLLTEGQSAAPVRPRTVVDVESTRRAGSGDSGAVQGSPQRRSWWQRLWEGTS